MQLTFQQAYKSIHHLPIFELPDFTVITGANGSGKTHFLQALIQGAVRVPGVELPKIKYYNWNDLLPLDVGAMQPRDLEEERNDTCQAIYGVCRSYLERLLHGKHEVSPTKQRQLEEAFQLLLADGENVEDVTYNQVAGVWTELEQQLKSAVKNNTNAIFNFYNHFYKRDSTEHLSCHHASVFLQILANTTKPFFLLTQEDCFAVYPLVSTKQDPFIGSLTGLFAGYVQARAKNAMSKALAVDYGAATTYLTKEEFLKMHGPPPWEIINRVLSEAKLSFSFQEPSSDPGRPLELHLQHTVAGVEVKFADLSSGERVLISLAQFLFFSQDPRQPTAMPDLILLDEVDAPLHPSMTVDLLRTITKVMVEQYGRKVILATHSPSTVALAPEESIHVMEVATKTIRRATRDEGVRSLTVGVPILSINISNRRQVFVESEHDVTLYERVVAVAQPHLRPDVSLTFMAAGHEKNGGCALLTSLVSQLKKAGNNTIFGIVDWDGERTPTNNLRVLGENVRHSIENYLFDPVLLGTLLLREKVPALISQSLLRDKETYFHLRDFDNVRLQQVSDAVVTFLNFPLDDLTQVSYANGRSVQVPKAYLRLRGHDLEERIKTAFPEQFRRFHQEPKFKEEILHKILEEMPELLPADFVTLLAGIQGASAS